MNTTSTDSVISTFSASISGERLITPTVPEASPATVINENVSSASALPATSVIPDVSVTWIVSPAGKSVSGLKVAVSVGSSKLTAPASAPALSVDTAKVSAFTVAGSSPSLNTAVISVPSATSAALSTGMVFANVGATVSASAGVVLDVLPPPPQAYSDSNTAAVNTVFTPALILSVSLNLSNLFVTATPLFFRFNKLCFLPV